METIRSLLDQCKESKGITSDYALAKALNIPKQRISNYYNSTGSKYPNNYACLKIAKALRKDLNEIIAIVQIEAEKDEKKRKIWREYYESIHSIAESIF